MRLSVASECAVARVRWRCAKGVFCGKCVAGLGDFGKVGEVVDATLAFGVAGVGGSRGMPMRLWCGRCNAPGGCWHGLMCWMVDLRGKLGGSCAPALFGDERTAVERKRKEHKKERKKQSEESKAKEGEKGREKEREGRRKRKGT